MPKNSALKRSSMCRRRRFPSIGVASTKESALKARGPVFPVTLELTETIYVYETKKEWTKALIGRYLKVTPRKASNGLTTA
jgi:hypothetical protein